MIVIKGEPELKEKIHPNTYESLLSFIDKAISQSLAAGEKEIDKTYYKYFILEAAAGAIGVELIFSYKVLTGELPLT